MQVCKNKNSGKYFIYIQDAGNDEALFVTPSAEIKSLNVGLFEEPEDKEEGYLVTNGLIADAQMQRFRQYEKENTENESENILYMYEQLSPYEQKRLREMISKRQLGEEAK